MLSFPIGLMEEENIGGSFCSLLPELLNKVWSAVGDQHFAFDNSAENFMFPNTDLLLRDLRTRGIIVGTCLDYHPEKSTASLSPAFQQLEEYRASVRSLVALASTCRWFYMDMRKRYKTLYYALAPLAMLYSPDAALLERQAVWDLSSDGVTPKLNTEEWYIAAARLCLWPGGHRTFVGFSVARYGSWRCVRSEATEHIIPRLTQDDLALAVHSDFSAVACEDTQLSNTPLVPASSVHLTRLFHWGGQGYSLFHEWTSHFDVRNSNYGHTCFVWSWWQSVLRQKGIQWSSGIETIRRLLDADAADNVRPLEESYWRIIYEACQPGPCQLHAKPAAGDATAPFKCPACKCTWRNPEKLRRHVARCFKKIPSGRVLETTKKPTV